MRIDDKAQRNVWAKLHKKRNENDHAIAQLKHQRTCSKRSKLRHNRTAYDQTPMHGHITSLTCRNNAHIRVQTQRGPTFDDPMKALGSDYRSLIDFAATLLDRLGILARAWKWNKPGTDAFHAKNIRSCLLDFAFYAVKPIMSDQKDITARRGVCLKRNRPVEASLFIKRSKLGANANAKAVVHTRTNAVSPIIAPICWDKHDRIPGSPSSSSDTTSVQGMDVLASPFSTSSTLTTADVDLGVERPSFDECSKQKCPRCHVNLVPYHCSFDEVLFSCTKVTIDFHFVSVLLFGPCVALLHFPQPGVSMSLHFNRLLSQHRSPTMSRRVLLQPTSSDRLL